MTGGRPGENGCALKSPCSRCDQLSASYLRREAKKPVPVDGTELTVACYAQRGTASELTTLAPAPLSRRLSAVSHTLGYAKTIEGDFNPRTLANMNVALDRVCGRSPMGEQHEVRKRVAHSLIQCAKSGKTTLAALTLAGERAFAQTSLKPRKSA